MIEAPMAMCFDLARSIDFHLHSVSSTKEQAVAGVTSGLIGPGQQVQWRARHFGLWLHMTVAITEMKWPFHFQDAMVKGPFRYFRHDHTFTQHDQGTVMMDRVEFASPVPVLGFLADVFFLRQYLRHFLQMRNRALKVAAESDQWRNYLSSVSAENQG
jgi:ligand-binding SRPBCC domain-containing protein